MELQDKKTRAVANWLILGVAMTIVQIALGGITRLTGSGLSITEWDVVTGTLPPLNQAAWQALFEKSYCRNFTHTYRLLRGSGFASCLTHWC